MSIPPLNDFLSGFSFYDYVEKNKKKSFFTSVVIPQEQPKFSDYLEKLVCLGVDAKNNKYYKIRTLANFNGNELPFSDIEEITQENFFSYKGSYGVIIFLDEIIIPTMVSIIIKGKECFYKFKKKSVIEINERGLGIGASRKITREEYYSAENEDLNVQRTVKKNMIVNRKEYEGLLTGKYFLIPRFIKFGNSGLTKIHMSSKDETKLKILLDDGTLNYREINHICEFMKTEFYQFGLLAFMRNYPDLFGFVINKNRYYKDLFQSGMEDGADLIEEKINFFITTFYFRLITFTDNNVLFKIKDFVDGKLICDIMNAFYGYANYELFREKLSNGIKIEREFYMKYKDLYDITFHINIKVVENEDGTYTIEFIPTNAQVPVITRDKTKVMLNYDFSNGNFSVKDAHKTYEKQVSIKEMKGLMKNIFESDEFKQEFVDFCKLHFHDNNKKYNYGTFIIMENRENGRENFLLKKYPNVRENSEKDYYIKLMKLSIIRFQSAILGKYEIPENMRNNFLEFGSGIIENSDFAKKKLFSAFDPYLRGKVKEGVGNIQQKRMKYGFSTTSGDVSNFSHDGIGFMRSEDDE